LSQGANAQNELPHYTPILIASDNQREKLSSVWLQSMLLQSTQVLSATREKNPYDNILISKSFEEGKHPHTENEKFTIGMGYKW
jgi:hypothetical protein